MIPVSVRYQSPLDAARAALSAGARVLTASCGLATAQAEDYAGVFGNAVLRRRRMEADQPRTATINSAASMLTAVNCIPIRNSPSRMREQ